MRSFLIAVLLAAGATAAVAQDRHSWESLAQLKPGDKVCLSLTTREPVNGEFQSWTQEQVTVETVSAKKEEVLKVERYRQGGWSRGKTAVAGAAIGFGGRVRNRRRRIRRKLLERNRTVLSRAARRERLRRDRTRSRLAR